MEAVAYAFDVPILNPTGPSVFAGVAVMVLFIPVNAIIAKKESKFEAKQMELKDERVKLMSEVRHIVYFIAF